MVRLLPIFIAFLLLPLLIKGQSVVCDPLTFQLTGTQSQTDVPYHIQVTNISNETIQIFWSKRMSNQPSQWISWICDKNLCYTPDIHTCPPSKPNIVAPGESIDVQVHMNPLQTIGTGDYELNIIDANGNNLCAINGDIEITLSTGVKETGDQKLTVYPNPTLDIFEVSETPGLKYIELFNIIGNKVRSFDAIPKKQYYVGDLPEGIYLVRLVSASKKVLKTVRLSKR